MQHLSRLPVIILFAVVESGWSIGPLSIVSATNANPVVLTTNLTHSYSATVPIEIRGASGSWAPINGKFTATQVSATTFSIPVNSTAFGALTGAIFVGAVRTVCNSTAEFLADGTPCRFSTVQAAFDATNSGDTVRIKSGQVHIGAPVLPGGKEDVTIEADKDYLNPQGDRITRGSPNLATLEGSSGNPALRVGDNWVFATVTKDNPTLTVPSGHGLAVNDVVEPFATHNTPFHCPVENFSTFGSDCSAARVGFFNLRYPANLAQANVGYMWFKGNNSMPGNYPPLLSSQPEPLTYTVDGGPVTPLENGTKLWVRDAFHDGAMTRFKLSLTPGGSAIVPQNYVFNSAPLFEWGPGPARNYQRLYVVASTATTVQLSATRGGSAIAWDMEPYTNDGGTDSRGFRIYKHKPVTNLTIKGLELRSSTTGTEAGFVLEFRAGMSDPTYTTGVKVIRCWIHGRDDFEVAPNQGVWLGANNFSMWDSIVENIYATGSDTQGVGISQSSGPFYFENNWLSATGQGVMSGGSGTTYQGLNGTDARLVLGLTYRRNVFYKDPRWSWGIRPFVTGGNLAMRSRYNSPNTCSTQTGATAATYNNSGGLMWRQCFVNDKDGTRHVLGSDVEWVLTGASGNATMVVYWDNDAQQLKMRHNLASGTINCPTNLTIDGTAGHNVDCAFDANPVIESPWNGPYKSKVLKATITSGAWSADNVQFELSKQASVKPGLEVKDGKYILIEGNIWTWQHYDAGIGQGMHINITQSQSSPAGPANYMMENGQVIVRYNWFGHAIGTPAQQGGSHEGFVFLGSTLGNVRKEVNWVREGKGFVIHNNHFQNIGNKRFSDLASGFDGATARTQYLEGVRFEHNTSIDTHYSVKTNSGAASGVVGTRRGIYRDNVFIPWNGSDMTAGIIPTPQAAADGCFDWVTCSSVATKAWDGTDVFTPNLAMNLNGVTSNSTRPTHYPTGVYLIQHTDADRNPATLFESWVSRDYAASNYRIKASEVSKYTTSDGAPIGANYDLIEAIMGPKGIDVWEGRQEFSRRRARRIHTITDTSAVLSYIPNGSSCTVELWPNQTYLGTKTVDLANDSSGTVSGGIRSVDLTGLSASTHYYGRQVCGTAIDMFDFTTAAGGGGGGGMAAAVLEDFDTLRKGPDGTTDLWLPEINGSQTLSIVNHDGDNRMRIVATAGGAFDVAARMMFYPNTGVGGNRYPYTQGFARHWIKSGTFSSTMNRLSYWRKCDYAMGFSQYGSSFDIGTYTKWFNASVDPDTQGDHWYLIQGAAQTANRWIKHTLFWSPQANNFTGDIEFPSDPTFQGGSGYQHDPPEHYYNGLTRFYVGTYFAPSFPVTCYFDNFVFHEDTTKPDYRLRSIAITYDGAKYVITVAGAKYNVTNYQVRYATSSMVTNGWASGTVAGNLTLPEVESYSHGQVVTANMAEVSRLYVAVSYNSGTTFWETWYDPTTQSTA